MLNEFIDLLYIYICYPDQNRDVLIREGGLKCILDAIALFPSNEQLILRYQLPIIHSYYSFSTIITSTLTLLLFSFFFFFFLSILII